jgi:hypothetical protein
VRLAIWVICPATLLLAGGSLSVGARPGPTADDLLFYFVLVQFALVLVALVMFLAFLQWHLPRAMSVLLSAFVVVIVLYDLWVLGTMACEDLFVSPHLVVIASHGEPFPVEGWAWYTYLLFVSPLLCSLAILHGLWPRSRAQPVQASNTARL